MTPRASIEGGSDDPPVRALFQHIVAPGRSPHDSDLIVLRQGPGYPTDRGLGRR